MSAIAERYEDVRRQVHDAADAVGRDPADVLIVAVAKTVGPGEVREAISVGIEDFGENRVQEFVAKQALFPGMRWHFVGTLQTNKVQHVVGKAHLIHSVDSTRLLDRISKVADDFGVIQPILLQVNVSGEPSKHGIPPEHAEELLERALELPGVEPRGLMTMAPLGPVELARPVFRGLHDLFESLRTMRSDMSCFTELSMGMTNDFRVAVEEGATIVRVGRAIFGK